MQPSGNKSRFMSALGNLILIMVGVGGALGVTEAMLRAFPNWVPSEVRVDPPVRRVSALLDETYDVKLSDGDLFTYMHGKISTVSPDSDAVLAHVHMVTDADGFRNALPEPTTCDIVALGDSFTRASGVADPWPQLVADATGMAVFNLAEVGVGPQQELNVLRRYGLQKHPRWVILAYFEGNDLYDAGAYQQANPFILPRLGKYFLDQGLNLWRTVRIGEASDTTTPKYQYPVTTTIGGVNLPVAFFSSYISWLTVSGQTLEASQNYRSMTDSILTIQNLTEAIDARLLIVYIPSKEHVYLPYFYDSELMASNFRDVPTIALDKAGFLQFTGQTATLELAKQHIDDQSSLLASFASEHKIDFLDLTATFLDEAGTGEELYYRYDTHWNASGHELAARAIAEVVGSK